MRRKRERRRSTRPATSIAAFCANSATRSDCTIPGGRARRKQRSAGLAVGGAFGSRGAAGPGGRRARGYLEAHRAGVCGALAGGVASGRLDEGGQLAALKLLDLAAASWVLLPLTDRVLHRARERFPQEPVRTLDALHLATAALTSQAYRDLAVLSLDV